MERGSPKQSRKRSKVAGVASDRTTEKGHGFEKVGITSKASSPQCSASGNAHDGSDRDRPDCSADDGQVIVGRAEHGHAEELIPRPAVTDLVGEVGVAQRPGATAHDQQQVVGRRLRSEDLARRQSHGLGQPNSAAPIFSDASRCIVGVTWL